MTETARILIVEDESLVAEDLQMRLLRLGYDVIGITDTADAAIETASRLTPDLVLLDIRLKGKGDGVDVAARLREKQIGFVFLTAHADRATLTRTGATEPLGYVVKPFEERGVHATIETALYRHRAEQRLRHMEHWLATTLRSIGDAVIVADCDRRISYMNPAGERVTGCDAATALGRGFHEVFRLVKGTELDPVDCPVARVLQNGEILYLQDEVFLQRPEGTLLPIDDCASPILDDDGKLLGAVVVFRDATDKRRLEAERRQVQKRLQDAEKLRGIGVLASGLAHDFNNILTTILGNVAVGQQDTLSQAERMRSLEAIETSALTAAALCRQMMSTAGVGGIDIQSVDANAAVRSATGAVTASLGDGISLFTELADGLPQIAADPTQLSQVLTNLLINAAEAIGETGGSIRVRTGSMHASARELLASVGAPEMPGGDFVFLDIQDDGPGMSQDTASQVFEPFFTTKFTGRGLGLASVLGIVRRHGGAIILDTRLGHGTTFRVLLPLAMETPVPTLPRPPAAARQHAQVLVIDDEKGIRSIVCRWLGNENYTCIEAENAEQGITHCEHHGAELAAVILDWMMPGTDGESALRRIRAWHPDLPVLLISGMPPNTRILHGYRRVAFLQKPFNLVELTSLLDQLLRSR